MRKLFCFFVLITNLSNAQLNRVEPSNFSSVYFFGGRGNFNDNEIAVSGVDGMLPNGINKVYLFSSGSVITPNGVLSSPEANQNISGGIEMTNDYLFIASTSNNTNVSNGGAVYIYKKVNGSWNYLSKLQPESQSENDYFGSKISFFDNQLFVTASGYDVNGSSTVNNGGIYHYYLTQNDNFSFVQVMTGNELDYGFGNMIDFENNMMVTTSENETTDTVYTFNQGNVSWGLVNTMQMPAFTQNSIIVKAEDRISFSNGKLYLFHLEPNNLMPVLEGKFIKSYNWSESQLQWIFYEDISFWEGDYMDYKVNVKGNNMYLIPVGFYFLQLPRKNPIFHYRFNGINWNYFNSYVGMSQIVEDNLGHYLVSKGDKVLFGNINERWNESLIYQPNGGAYMLNNTLKNSEFEDGNVILFPNPTNGIISIKTNYKLKQVELFDGLGKLVLMQKTNFESIDLTNLNSGIYFCKLTDELDNFEFKKIIKR